MISNTFGIDDHSPLFLSLEQARSVAQRMLEIYHGNIRVEIYQMLDLQFRDRRLVETLGFVDESWKNQRQGAEK